MPQLLFRSVLVPLMGAIALLPAHSAWAQDVQTAQVDRPDVPRTLETLPRDLQEPIPQPPLPSTPLPPLTEPLPVPAPTPLPETPLEDVPATIRVERFEVQGSTVFSPAELAAVAAQAVSPPTDSATPQVPSDLCPQHIDTANPRVARSLSFTELLQARSAITQLYVNCGYINSGALIPPQTLVDGVVVIQVVEGSLEAINVTGTQHLQADYVRRRLAIAAGPPLNVNRLLEALQLLQLNPLIASISADLQAGVRPGTSLLEVQVTEADPFSVDFIADNGRSPSVGSLRGQVQLNQANLLGFGDSLFVGFAKTEGSTDLDLSYTIPINPRNGILRLAGGLGDSEVIEEPFNVLDIQSNSSYFELSLRQPLFQSPTEDFALGLTLSTQQSKTEFLDEELPFPSPGADDEGRTRVTALRFFQEWTQRSGRQVLAARSQFSLGLEWLDANVSDIGADSRFFDWRGQGQWVRLLAPDTLLLLRGDVQLSSDPLLPVEQFSLGGDDSVRGYRQDLLLADNGVLFTAEVRLPLLRTRRNGGLLQIAPFFDIGTGWNVDDNDPDPNLPDTLASVGLGLIWQQGSNFSARLDWGIPLTEVDTQGDSLQEDGIYFEVIYTPF